MEIFIIGSFWFWLLIAIASIFILVSLEYESWGGTGATITFIIAASLFTFFGGREDLKALGNFLINSPERSILYLLSYFGIGVVWSFIKWYFFLLNLRDKLLYKISNKENIGVYELPKAKDEYGRIISWMCYWMFSMIWTLINDPIKRTFKFIYMRLEGLYQKIADKMFADIKAGMNNKK